MRTRTSLALTSLALPGFFLGGCGSHEEAMVPKRADWVLESKVEFFEADAKTPASYDYNVAITERVARMAHWVGASVEGELGVTQFHLPRLR